MINIDNLPLKYLTGSYRFGKDYPTETDFLYDLVQTGKRKVGVGAINWIDPDTARRLCDSLLQKGYIGIADDLITVKKTPWDDEHNEQ